MKAFFQKLFGCQSAQIAEVKNESVFCQQEFISALESIKKESARLGASYKNLIPFGGSNFEGFSFWVTKEIAQKLKSDLVNKHIGENEVSTLYFKNMKSDSLFRLFLLFNSSPIVSKETEERALRIFREEDPQKIFSFLRFAEQENELKNRMNRYFSLIRNHPNNLTIEEVCKVFAENTENVKIVKNETSFCDDDDKSIEFVTDVSFLLDEDYLVTVSHTKDDTYYQKSFYVSLEVKYLPENLVIFSYSV